MNDETVLIRLFEMISVEITARDINSAKAEQLSRNKMGKGEKTTFR